MTNDKQRERLVELIGCACQEYAEYSSEMFAEGNYGIESMEEHITDYILKRGVLCPPCKVGQTVYVIEPCNCGHKYGELCGGNRIRKNTKWLEIVKLPPAHHYTRCLKLFERPFRIEYLNRIGKTVFLTKEEAEKALGGVQG